MPAKPKHPLAAKTPALTKPPIPKEARSFPPLALWLSQPENVIHLQVILADPVFIAACHYVEGTLEVTPDDLIGSKAALKEVIVRKASMAAGFRSFMAVIATLPKYHEQQAAKIPAPWEHIQAPTR